MPLIKCVDCGKEISDRARNCPNCGCPVICSVPVESSSLNLGAFPPVPAMEQPQQAPAQQQAPQQVSQQQATQQQNVQQQNVQQQNMQQQNVQQQNVQQQNVQQQNVQQQNVQQQNVQQQASQQQSAQQTPVTPVETLVAIPVETPVAVPVEAPKKKKSGGKVALTVILILLIVGALGVGGYLLYEEFWASSPAQPYIPNVSNQSGSTTAPQASQGATAPEAPTVENSETTPAAVPETKVTLPAALKRNWVGTFDQVSFVQDGDKAYLEVDTFIPESRQWSHDRIEIASITNDTFVLNGKNPGSAYEYTVQGDTLYVNERYYTRNKHLSDPVLAGYMKSSLRIYGNIFFGMTKEEILKYANTNIKFNHLNGIDFYLELPPILPQVPKGDVYCNVDDQGKLEELWLNFEAKNCVSKPETVRDALVNMYSITYGGTQARTWHDGTTVSYDWLMGDLRIRIIDWGDGSYTVTYDMT